MMGRGIRYFKASDVRDMMQDIIDKLQLKHLDVKRIICIRSQGTKTNAVARIYGLPRIWQKALNIKPYYIIEVISERYDSLPQEEKIRVLIHELLHIPETFSGGLRQHGKLVNNEKVNELYIKYVSASK